MHKREDLYEEFGISPTGFRGWLTCFGFQNKPEYDETEYQALARANAIRKEKGGKLSVIRDQLVDEGYLQDDAINAGGQQGTGAAATNPLQPHTLGYMQNQAKGFMRDNFGALLASYPQLFNEVCAEMIGEADEYFAGIANGGQPEAAPQQLTETKTTVPKRNRLKSKNQKGPERAIDV